MCLVGVAFAEDRLVLAGNRDEFHARATAAADWWPGRRLLGGRDLEAGGGWLLVGRRRLAVVTNFRDPAELGRPARSRGELVVAWVKGRRSPAAHADRVWAERADYNSFNLLLWTPGELWYVGSRFGVRRLEPGTYGLSNALLDTPWPKVEALKQRMHGGDLFSALGDRATPPDEALPDTGVGPERERLLAPAFIAGEVYGTRASTVVHWRGGRGSFVERSFGPGGLPLGERRFDW